MSPNVRQRFVSPVAQAAWLWLWSAIVGALAVAATSGFRWLARQVDWLATGLHADGLVASAHGLAPWHRALVCAVGGLLAGALLQAGLAWARRGPRGDKHLDYMEAARAGNADLNDRTTLTRSVSALVSIGTGASIGREGPMVQLAAWLASWPARLLPFNAQQRNALMVAGVAAGIGCAYHAPVAGVVFVLELALGFFARETLAPVFIASATAGALLYGLVDPAPLYVMPTLPLAPVSLGLALAAGVFFGAVAWILIELLEAARKLFAGIPMLALRLGAGGVLVGLVSMAVPEVWGNGYSVVSRVLQGELLWQALLAILLAKVAATALSSGSGAIGGVFTPSLLVGAAAGSLVTQLVLLWLPPGMVGDPRALAVIGMAAVLAGVTHAPLMAIVMVLEMTRQFQLTVPIMLASGVAFSISTQFGVRPIYGNPIEGAGRAR
jgi:CIC family chloride channel protein